MSKAYCPNCYNEFEIEPKSCSCGYPFKGSDIDRYKFMSVVGEKEKIIQEGIDSAVYSRNILFLIGGLSLLVSIIFMFLNEDNTFNIITAVYSSVLLGLGFYSYKEPFFALLLGFLVLIMAYVITAIINPMQLLTGMIVRIAIICTFVYGLIKIKRSDNIHKAPEKNI